MPTKAWTEDLCGEDCPMAVTPIGSFTKRTLLHVGDSPSDLGQKLEEYAMSIVCQRVLAVHGHTQMSYNG